MIYAGIDYSLTSPSICVYNNVDEFSFSACTFYVLNDRKCHTLPNIKIKEHSNYDSSNRRYENISDYFLPILSCCDSIMIEDYSMGSKGKVFHIAENTEVLQFKLYKMNKNYDKVPPTTLKKWASGKGNATKEIMYKSFISSENIDLIDLLGFSKKNKLSSPITDIVDSFFLCKYAIEKHK
mgnify:FL=1